MTESNQSVSAKQVRDVVALGKKYSKTAFPNPTRDGCPNFSTLRAMAYRDRRLSLEDLPVSHVVSCSPCFQEYARLRRMSVLMRGIQVTAASLVVLAVLFAAVRFVWNYTRGRGEPSISQEHRAEPQPRVATQQAPARYCSACDDCKFGFLLPDPRRGGQGFGEQDTSPTEIAPRQLSFARWHGTRRIRTSTEGFCWNRTQRHACPGAIERRHHFGRGGSRSHCRIPRQLYLDDSATRSELANISCSR